VEAVWRLAKGVRIPRWEKFAAELKEAGLHMPPINPEPGSVMAFDATGHAEALMRGAQQPEEFVTAVRTRLGDNHLIEVDTVHARIAETAGTAGAGRP
jgi:hypothetical protein